jgi:hypothetical protein
MTQDSQELLSRRSLLERASLLGTLALGLPGAASAGATVSAAPERFKVVVAGGHPGVRISPCL